MKPSMVSAVLVLCIAGYFGYNVIYLRNRQQLDLLQAQLAEQQETQNVRVQVAQSLKQIEQFRKRLPPQAETEWLVSQINRLAQSAGVQFASINPQPPKPVQEFTWLSVTVQFTGSYHQLGQFVSTIENAEPFLRIDGLEISPPRQGAAIEVRMTVSTLCVPALVARFAPGASGAEVWRC